MVAWKRICCAVDLEEPSRVAMMQSVELARRFEAELTLVHVRVPPPPAATDMLVTSRTLAEVEAREDEETLARWRDDAEERAGRPVQSLVLLGDPAAEVVRHARETRCDLVVVGTHGRGGIARFVLGSVAERVVRQSPCPVLVVHDHAVVEQAEIADGAAAYR